MVVSSWWMAFWCSSRWWLSTQIHQMWRSQHLCVAMGVLLLGLVGVAVLVPVGDGVDMLGMLQPFSWYLHLFQANIHIVLHSTGTWWFPCVLRVWLVVFPLFPRVGWWELLPWGLVHLLQSWHYGGCGKGVVLWVCPWHPQAILHYCVSKVCRSGSSWIVLWNSSSSLGWCGHSVWLCQVLLLDQSVVSTLTVHQQLASPFQVSTLIVTS